MRPANDEALALSESEQYLRRYLTRLQKIWTGNRNRRHYCLAGLIILIISDILLVLARIWEVAGWLMYWSVPVLLGLAFIRISFVKPVPLSLVASFLDNHCHLAERVISGYYCLEDASAIPCRPWLLQDAAVHLARLPFPPTQLPAAFTISPRLRLSIAIGSVILVGLHLPAPFTPTSQPTDLNDAVAVFLESQAEKLRHMEEPDLAVAFHQQASDWRKQNQPSSSAAASSLKKLAEQTDARVQQLYQQAPSHMFSRYRPSSSSLTSQDAQTLAQKILNLSAAECQKLDQLLQDKLPKSESDFSRQLRQAIEEKDAAKLSLILRQAEVRSRERLSGLNQISRSLEKWNTVSASPAEDTDFMLKPDGRQDGGAVLDTPAPPAQPHPSRLPGIAENPPERGGNSAGLPYLKKACWPSRYQAVVQAYFSQNE